MERAEREQDLGRAAELRFGTNLELKRELAAAEARNYGDRPWGGEAVNYRCLAMDQLTPAGAARAVGEFLFAGEAP